MLTYATPMVEIYFITALSLQALARLLAFCNGRLFSTLDAYQRAIWITCQSPVSSNLQPTALMENRVCPNPVKKEKRKRRTSSTIDLCLNGSSGKFKKKEKNHWGSLSQMKQNLKIIMLYLVPTYEILFDEWQIYDSQKRLNVFDNI